MPEAKKKKKLKKSETQRDTVLTLGRMARKTKQRRG